MAVRHLPVVRPDPFRWPRTVADCEASPRPCPIVRCRFNLLVDVTPDGTLILNVPGRSVDDRQFPDKRDHKANLVWYVEVRLPALRVGDRLVPQVFALGPCGTRERAEQVALAWSARNGGGTAAIHRTVPENYAVAGPPRDGAIDQRFADEAEDAVSAWFDEPDPGMPSCLLDEIGRLTNARKASGDDDVLLDEIGARLHVSRERVRQIEVGARDGFRAGMARLGLVDGDLMEER